MKRVFFIGISSFILPRKFYFRIPLRSGGITLALRTAQTIDTGELPMADAAMMKVYSSKLTERLAIALSNLLGPNALLSFGEPDAVLDGSDAFGLPDSLLFTIGGGTNEIQRTLIAQRGLGLPR